MRSRSCLLKPRDIHSGPTSLGDWARSLCRMPSFVVIVATRERCWFMAGKISWTFGGAYGSEIGEVDQIFFCVFLAIGSVEVEVQSVHSVNYNSVFSGSLGGDFSQPQFSSSPNMMIFQLIIVLQFSKIVWFLLAAVILGFKHFLLSLFECRFFLLWIFAGPVSPSDGAGALSVAEKERYSNTHSSTVYCILTSWHIFYT